MKQYIFTQNASYSAMINGVLTVIKTFSKGDTISGTPVNLPSGGYYVSYVVAGIPSPLGNIKITNMFIKPIGRNSNLTSTPIESSYFGGMQSEESQENLKSAFAVIGIATYILIFYLLFTDYPKQ